MQPPHRSEEKKEITMQCEVIQCKYHFQVGHGPVAEVMLHELLLTLDYEAASAHYHE